MGHALCGLIGINVLVQVIAGVGKYIFFHYGVPCIRLSSFLLLACGLRSS